jgi:hypothetical protein
MPFKPGQPRPAGAGRKPGSSPKATVAAILLNLKCDPVAGLATLAADEKNKPEVRARCYAELLQYVHPKKRSIEQRFVDGEGNDREMLDLASVRAYMQAVPDA